MKCLDCGGELVGSNHRGIALDRCDGCRAVWFDRSEALAYLHGTAVGERVEAGEASTGGEAPRTCPRCGDAACTAREVHGIAFRKCARCGGTHVSSASLMEIHGRARRELRRSGRGDGMSGADRLALLGDLLGS